ncbi:MAG: VOC family protein [Actinomycetota bacterium]
MAVKFKPDGYSSVTPYLVVEDAAGLIDFIKSVFGGNERMRMPMPNGGVGHAEVEVGDSLIMMSDSSSTDNNITFPGMLNLYVEDCDTVYKAALAAGAESAREPATQFYGDRNAVIRDPFGNTWSISTHVEDVPPEEMGKRMAEWAKQNG